MKIVSCPRIPAEFTFSPTRAPSPWDGVRTSDKFSPVCPQRLPNILNETAALEKMPKGRLEYLKRLLPFLQNQSEDCLYLNVFAPVHAATAEKKLAVMFNKTNVDLLKKMYKSHEDVDFYVGGLLEAFEAVGSPFAGETFGCIIGENYNNAMGGDRWFYSHPENPNPFTKAQIDAIRKYQIPHLFCTNSGLKDVTKMWSYTPNPTNPKVECTNYPPMDLSAWS